MLSPNLNSFKSSLNCFLHDYPLKFDSSAKASDSFPGWAVSSVCAWGGHGPADAHDGPMPMGDS